MWHVFKSVQASGSSVSDGNLISSSFNSFLLHQPKSIYDNRNGHMLTHRNKKPYECKAEGCGKSYCDARSLRRHTENHHSSLVLATTTTTTTSSSQNQSNSMSSNNASSGTSTITNPSLSPATASGKFSQLSFFFIHSSYFLFFLFYVLCLVWMLNIKNSYKNFLPFLI